MGVDAQVLITGETDPLEVARKLYGQPHVTDVLIHPTGQENFVWMNFKWHGEQRHMSMFYNGNCQNDYKYVYPFPAMFCIIGKWGFSNAIVVYFAETFGGFYRLSDSYGDWKKAEEH